MSPWPCQITDYSRDFYFFCWIWNVIDLGCQKEFQKCSKLILETLREGRGEMGEEEGERREEKGERREERGEKREEGGETGEMREGRAVRR